MNAGTIFVLILLIAAVSLVVRRMIKNKREGKTCQSCGGNCSCCSEAARHKVHGDTGKTP